MKKKQASKNMRASDMFVTNMKGLMAMQEISASEMQGYMGIGETTYYKRLKRPYEFTLDNVERVASRLGVAPADMLDTVMTVGADRRNTSS